MTATDIAVEVRPTPPCEMGRDRYAGTQRLNPHHAKRQHAFISVRIMVKGRSLPRKISATPPRVEDAVLRLFFQISGSSTLRRIHSVKKAGRTPTKKTARQPAIGITTAATRAANA